MLIRSKWLVCEHLYIFGKWNNNLILKVKNNNFKIFWMLKEFWKFWQILNLKNSPGNIDKKKKLNYICKFYFSLTQCNKYFWIWILNFQKLNFEFSANSWFEGLDDTNIQIYSTQIIMVLNKHGRSVLFDFVYSFLF